MDNERYNERHRRILAVILQDVETNLRNPQTEDIKDWLEFYDKMRDRIGNRELNL